MREKIKSAMPQAIIVLALLAPPISVGTLVLRPEFILGCIVFGYLGITCRRSLGELRTIRPVNIWLVALAGSIMLSGIFAHLMLDMKFSARDLTELIRIGYYFLILNLAFITARKRCVSQNLKLMLVGLLAVIGFSLLQYVNFAGINRWLTPIYATPDQMLILNSDIPRVVGTLGNSNLFGFVLACSVALQTSHIIMSNFTLRRRAFLFACLLLVFATIIVTFSRTAIVLAVFGIIIVIGFGFIHKQSSRRHLLIAMGGFLLLAVSSLAFAPEGFFIRMKYALNITQDPSFRDRITMWQVAWEYFLKSPIFGWGPAKQSMATFVDNEYVLVLRRYGLIGVVCYLGIFISLFVRCWTVIRKSPKLVPLAAGLGSVVLICMAFGVTAGMFYNVQMSSLFWILAGNFLGLQHESEGRPNHTGTDSTI